MRRLLPPVELFARRSAQVRWRVSAAAVAVRSAATVAGAAVPAAAMATTAARGSARSHEK